MLSLVFFFLSLRRERERERETLKFSGGASVQ